jgi:hypothetical protein
MIGKQKLPWDGMHARICQTKLPVISFNLFNLKNMDGMHARICQTKLPVISFNLFNLKIWTFLREDISYNKVVQKEKTKMYLYTTMWQKKIWTIIMKDTSYNKVVQKDRPKLYVFVYYSEAELELGQRCPKFLKIFACELSECTESK